MAVLGFAACLTPSARGQIHAVGFERPLVAVADSPKAEREGQALQELAIEARKHGPAWLAGELEAFLEASPESAWAPSVRANLGVFYHQCGAFTPALAHWE